LQCTSATVARLLLLGVSSGKSNTGHGSCRRYSCCHSQMSVPYLSRFLRPLAGTFQTLYTQQQILTKANVPYFQGPAIDDATLDVQSKICSVLHSAFVLHHKVGELGHRALLVKLQQRLQKEIDDNMANAATTAEVAMTSLPPPPPNMGQYAQTGSMAVPPSGFIPPPPPPPHHMSFPPPPAFAPPPPPPPPPGQYSYGNQQQQYHY
jgi:hypothetical protein